LNSLNNGVEIVPLALASSVEISVLIPVLSCSRVVLRAIVKVLPGATFGNFQMGGIVSQPEFDSVEALGGRELDEALEVETVGVRTLLFLEAEEFDFSSLELERVNGLLIMVE